ncbi:CheY chemotaxis protein or a CheY-like REC (receiver) domain [Saccharicrinis carchari]|uniref:CheY chemotaxis protein or a CheY-like REC (Receiver) domain n=1 Tax=Saccharicrinis carchari TaxID=1168039 RepID=A0A521DYR4_SACCC|nr:response regulator [Saccharicrinis carchari]SMO76857.1 CheY chemotaxis protein or a CheY-like REC (receiver) domain [Saccharicrinis carchari]
MKNAGVVLYVDDEPINLKLFNIMFRNIFKIITAQSGSEALELLQSNPEVNVVVSDMKMPGMNGLEFIETARIQRGEIPFFLLSGYGMTPEIEKALNDQLIDGYFQKPLKKSLVEQELIKHMN